MQNVGETQIRRLIRDPRQPDWSEVPIDNRLEENIVNIEKAHKVQVNGIVYRSVRDASKKTGIDRRTLTRRLRSSNHDSCFYIDTNENQE